MAMTDDAARQKQDALDDRGTTPAQGVELLRKLRDTGFDASDEKLAVALGRTADEIERLLSGEESPDEDIVMKARGIATQRGLEIE